MQQKINSKPEKVKKILVIIGTRPEAIKLAPLVKQLNLEADCKISLCTTGQHSHLVDEVLQLFELKPQYQLEVLKKGQSLSSLSARLFSQLEPIIITEKPEWVIIHGDTTTAMVASLVAFYQKVKICHIEAGLRTENKWAPYPEEINRQVIARVADLNCAPTETARVNLINEGINPETIIVTGNTIVDSINQIQDKNSSRNYQNLWPQLKSDKQIVLVTIHRRENQGKPIAIINKVLQKINSLNETIQLVFVLHPNPTISNQIREAFEEEPDVTLLESQPYDKFVMLMSQAYLIITDSGGIQEEAPSLGKPVVVLRSETERKESITQGLSVLVGNDEENITTYVQKLLDDTIFYQSHLPERNPYGDGQASQRIVSHLIRLG